MPWTDEGFEPSDYDKARVGKILRGDGDWFEAHLFRLIAKADRANYAILKKAYPAHVAAVEAYMMSEAPELPLFPREEAEKASSDEMRGSGFPGDEAPL